MAGTRYAADDMPRYFSPIREATVATGAMHMMSLCMRRPALPGGPCCPLLGTPGTYELVALQRLSNSMIRQCLALALLGYLRNVASVMAYDRCISHTPRWAASCVAEVAMQLAAQRRWLMSQGGAPVRGTPSRPALSSSLLGESQQVINERTCSTCR